MNRSEEERAITAAVGEELAGRWAEIVTAAGIVRDLCERLGRYARQRRPPEELARTRAALNSAERRFDVAMTEMKRTAARQVKSIEEFTSGPSAPQ